MGISDAFGWAACLMTFVTFVQQKMLPLRIAAILANVFFIGYASIGHYLPVLALHASLLPVNCHRLFSLAFFQPKETSNSALGEAETNDLGNEQLISNFIAGLSGLP